jgi:uncharacterized protein YecT (DUF1311 family)
MRSVFHAVIFSIVGWAGVAHAASFDCSKAANRVEHMICADIDLNIFDSQLQGAYAGALDRSLHPEKVTADQRAWLTERDACNDAKCMTASYQRRIAALAKISDEPKSCAGATTLEVDACGAEYARRADRELTRYLAAARKRLADETANSKTSKDALTGLDASQKAWDAFRKTECDAVYTWWSEGTIRGSMYQSCMQSLSKSRTEQIWATWLSFEDSTPPLMPKPFSK